MTKIFGGVWQVSNDQVPQEDGHPSATSLAMVKSLLEAVDAEKARQDALFEFIRTTYFPRWDRAHEWTTEWGNAGHDCKKKKIVTKNGDRESMIHEICHVITSLSHGKRWQARMEQAAQKAESIGNAELAKGIRKGMRNAQL